MSKRAAFVLGGVAPILLSIPLMSGASSYQPSTERGYVAGEIVRKWSGAGAKAKHMTPMAWAQAMGPAFATAPLSNLRLAMKADSLDEVLLRIDGTPSGEVGSLATAARLTLSTVSPCRIVDTRITQFGKILSGTTRSFRGNNPGGDFRSQGGTDYDCAIPADAEALVMRVTVAETAGSGHLTVFPYGDTLPLAASLNYTGSNAVIGNQIIAKQASSGSAYQFTVLASSTAHVIVDVVGYYARAKAPVLTCIQSWNFRKVTLTRSGGLQFVSLPSPACPTSEYFVSGVKCRSTNARVHSLGYNHYPGRGCTFIDREPDEGFDAEGIAAPICCTVTRQ